MKVTYCCHDPTAYLIMDIVEEGGWLGFEKMHITAKLMMTLPGHLFGRNVFVSTSFFSDILFGGSRVGQMDIWLFYICINNTSIIIKF